MKTFVQIIDTKTGIYQTGMIDEPVQKGFEFANAIGHFGINIGNVDWISNDASDYWKFKFGTIRGTSKIINVTMI